MDNLTIYSAVRQVPEEAQKKIGGGRLNGMTDINPMWRIKTLTEQFGTVGFGWYYEIRDQRIVDGANGEKSAFVDIALYVKVGNEWSKPIIGVGGSSFIVREKNGPYTNDECFKMALTDAISVACKAIGIGADVYWAKDANKYDMHEGAQTQNDIDREIAEDNILRAIKMCQTVDEISTVYKQNRSVFKNQNRLIEACSVRKKELAA